jgi:hypothetical protein
MAFSARGEVEDNPPDGGKGEFRPEMNQLLLPETGLE